MRNLLLASVLSVVKVASVHRNRRAILSRDQRVTGRQRTMSQRCRPCHGPSRRPLTVTHPYGLGEGSTQRQRQRHTSYTHAHCHRDAIVLHPPRPTAQLWIDRPMTPKSAPLPPVLPPPLPGGPLQGLPCYGGQSQYMCRNIATFVACVISCLCMRAFLERRLPGRAADVSVLITMPSWNGNMCGSALLEGQCSRARVASVHRAIF